MMTFIDNYEWTSGWLHDYYCDKDGSELIFDLSNNKYFKCPVCKFKYTDEKRKRAWITKYRYRIFKLLENYSEKYLENKTNENLIFIEDALNYYSLNYDKFAIHNKAGEIFDTIINTSNRCGRITSQGLNEAMISIHVVNCIRNISLYLETKTENHIFNLLFLDDQTGNWTFVDTMWEKQFLRIRDKNRFSFVALEDIQSEPHDEYGAHMHIIQDISNISTISINMEDIDKKLGYHNKLCLYQWINDIVWYIKYGEIDEIKDVFGEQVEYLLNKNPMIQYICLVSIMASLELGNTGLKNTDKRPDESARICCLDTYLKETLPTIYITLFSDRIKQFTPSALNDYNSQVRYLSELFKDIRVKDGNIGIHVDDMVDQAYINIGFDAENNPQWPQIVNSIYFEKKFGTISEAKPEPNHEIAD